MTRSLRDHQFSAVWVWSLPLEVGSDGQLKRQSQRTFEQTARLILEVVPGERPLAAEFGWKAHLMTRLQSAEERAVAAVYAEDALCRWAPELGVERVDVIEVDSPEVILEIRCRGQRHRLKVCLRGRWNRKGPTNPSSVEPSAGNRHQGGAVEPRSE